MVPSWRQKEEKVRRKLEKEFGVKLEEHEVPLSGTSRGYKFDLVSPDGSIVGEIKTYVYHLPSGNRPSAKMAHAGDACLLLIHAKGAKRKLLIFTDREFYEKYRRERQAEIATSHGIEIRLVET